MRSASWPTPAPWKAPARCIGGAYPAAVLYVTPAYIQNNGPTVQALANAFVRGLRWIDDASRRRDRRR